MIKIINSDNTLLEWLELVSSKQLQIRSNQIKSNVRFLRMENHWQGKRRLIFDYLSKRISVLYSCLLIPGSRAYTCLPLSPLLPFCIWLFKCQIKNSLQSDLKTDWKLSLQNKEINDATIKLLSILSSI